jgi:hypothetical protein
MKSILAIILLLTFAGCDVQRQAAVDASHATGQITATGSATFATLAASASQPGIRATGQATAYAAPGAFSWWGHVLNVAKGAVVVNITSNVQVGPTDKALVEKGAVQVGSDQPRDDKGLAMIIAAGIVCGVVVFEVFHVVVRPLVVHWLGKRR